MASPEQKDSPKKGRIIITAVLVLAIGGGLIALSQGKKLVEIRMRRMAPPPSELAVPPKAPAEPGNMEPGTAPQR
jgi:hypothetical protein